jgi:hypothetical protein
MAYFMIKYTNLSLIGKINDGDPFSYFPDHIKEGMEDDGYRIGRISTDMLLSFFNDKNIIMHDIKDISEKEWLRLERIECW